VPGLCSPTAVAVSRRDLERFLCGRQPLTGFDDPAGPYPCLIRPYSSHAGAGLSQVTSDADLYGYLRLSLEDRFFVTRFQDYQDPLGFYRKFRIAFIDRQPFSATWPSRATGWYTTPTPA